MNGCAFPYRAIVTGVVLLRKQCYKSSCVEVIHLPFQADGRASSFRCPTPAPLLTPRTNLLSFSPSIKTSSLVLNAHLNQSIVPLLPSEPVNHLAKSSSTTVAPAHPQSRKDPEGRMPIRSGLTRLQAFMSRIWASS